MNVEILEEARLDIADGVAFYDSQSENAGNYFYKRIFDDIIDLEDTAGVHALFNGYHRKLASYHPYIIYYRVLCVIMVYATNWTVGLAYGIFSGALLAFGVPLILLIAGRKQRALRKGESLAEH